ncbi:hypothetical protein TNCV_2101051 [Trichonephila clavipes]|nr:hypothetical protein TNCV_2101051 [Trichonephila clavipes]
MKNHRIFQRLYRQPREMLSFHVIRHDVVRQRAVRSPSLEESILNVVAVRPMSITRNVTHHGCGSRVVKVSDQGRHVMNSSLVPLKDPPCRAAMHVKSVES